MGRLLSLFKRPPDFIVGRHDDPYLKRWWLIPRNRFFNIYLHQFLRSDDDRALHDHPWTNCSLVLKGWYIEHLPGAMSRVAGPWSLRFRRAMASHRIELPYASGGGVWTLFFTGPVVREWGFHCPHGWVHWKDFTDPNDPGAIGPGCDGPARPSPPPEHTQFARFAMYDKFEGE